MLIIRATDRRGNVHERRWHVGTPLVIPAPAGSRPIFFEADNDELAVLLEGLKRTVHVVIEPIDPTSPPAPAAPTSAEQVIGEIAADLKNKEQG